MKLTPGQQYDPRKLRHTGWEYPPKANLGDYNWLDYFTIDGVYLGPDEHGVEPIVSLLLEDPKRTAIEQLKAAQKNPDTTRAHEEADDILCDLLDAIGYADIVREYQKVDKWYE